MLLLLLGPMLGVSHGLLAVWGVQKPARAAARAAFVNVLTVFLTVAQTALTDMVVAAPLQLQQLFANRHWVLLWCRSPLSRARTVGLVLVYKYYYSNIF